MQKFLTEFIGTFFLVLTICLTVAAGIDMAPLAIGCSLMVMVYMGGHVSGAHYNPAVSLAVLLRGKMESKDFVPYLLSQILGGLAAAAVAYSIHARTIPIGPGTHLVDGIRETFSTTSVLLIEILFTFALALVVLNVATTKATEGNSFYGLAIGFTIVVGAFAGGSVSGGAFNPAVGIALTTMHALYGEGSWENLWLYLVGPLAGGALAAIVYKIQHAVES